MKALIMAADGFEDMELHYPLYRLKEEGWDVTIAGPYKGIMTGKHGYTTLADTTFSKLVPKEYDLLVIPGGKAPEAVRLDMDALKTVKRFMGEDRPVAAICHGLQVLVSAETLEGRKATCWKGIRDDILAAGAMYTDSEVVVDGNLVTSRMPDDLPAFMREVFRLAAKAGIKATAKLKKAA
ncbi:MAG: type 1 glutamine amidotransferase [Nitrospirae bacterium]|nr:type 1 glutamine amidotransferase [Nitrospirota bacterium]